MILRETFLPYKVFVIKDFNTYTKEELVNQTIRLLKPYDDSVVCTADAIDNASKYGLLYVVLDQEEIIGICVVVNFRLNGFIPTHHMAYLGIDEKHQRKGIAKKVIEISIKDAKGEMSLHVDLDNKAAHELYSKMGYKFLYNRYLYGREH